MSTKYSIIIPVYNSEEIVQRTVETVISCFSEWELDCEILLINDGSTDASWSKLEKLSASYSNVRSFDLLKNYGQHTAVLCGIKNSTGDYLITMDDDMQNPPREAIKLISEINKGYDLVFGRFPVKKHKRYRRLGTVLINYLNSKIFKKPKNITLTNFRIFTQAVGQRVASHRTYHPYIPGLLLMYSGKISNTFTEHAPRLVGASNYSLIRIIKLVARLLFNYSSYPLKILTGVGFIIAFVSFVLGAFYIIRELTIGTAVQGWTTMIVLLSFFNGFLFIMLGVLGEYITRMMTQISTVDSFQVREKLN
jgi:glycosyltransferase involved in cell wall biosynthesis